VVSISTLLADGTSRMKLSPVHKKLLRVAAALVVAAFCFYFFRNVRWRELGANVAEARWQLIAAAAGINFVHLLVKAARWGVLLRPVGRVGLLPLFRYTLGSYAASNILPARFGEVLKVFYLRPHGIRPEGAVGVQVLEKVYETVGILVLLLPIPFVLRLPPQASHTLILVTIGGTVGVGVMYWMARRHKLGGGLLARIGEGMKVLERPRLALAGLILSVAVWILDIIEVMLVMAAVGITPGFFTAVLVLMFINFAIMAPSLPAQVGAFEAGAVFGLGLLGVGKEQALAFGMIYHFMQAIPVTVAGMEALVLWRTLREEAAVPKAAAHAVVSETAPAQPASDPSVPSR
jgi:uncharacterized membrane protein YbhN (UPF0104 family)